MVERVAQREARKRTKTSDDMLMFSTDYPHWDYDNPDRAFPVRLPDALKRKIFSENARALYRFEGETRVSG
jgi:predicted TIM-barrel fold metal-dependent hydrolase